MLLDMLLRIVSKTKDKACKKQIEEEIFVLKNKRAAKIDKMKFILNDLCIYRGRFDDSNNKKFHIVDSEINGLQEWVYITPHLEIKEAYSKLSKELKEINDMLYKLRIYYGN